jgi:two-component system response regulator AtoC
MKRNLGEDYLRDYAPLLGNSPAMRAIRDRIERIADTDATVLIRGESGVGKEIVAKAIHEASVRRGAPCVKVNCAALPAELLESELFGHEKGAFTGAHRRKLGKFELAHRGTLFLDEIGELPISLQSKLLHAVQDHVFARIGGTETITVDVRVIAATNRPLESAVRTGPFREDLYYRLKVVTLTVPPLRERPEEVPGLVRTFLERYNAQYRRAVTLGPRSLDLLRRYPWPGNVRELENIIKLVVVLQDPSVLERELDGAVPRPALPAPAPALPAPAAREEAAPEPAREPLHLLGRRASLAAQREAIAAALERARWNRVEAAKALHVSYKSLLYKMDQCGLSRKLTRRLA